MRRKEPILKEGSIQQLLVEYSFLIAGCFLVAASFNLLLNPNKIPSGGVVGLSVILNGICGLEPATIQWVINAPLFIAAIILLGRKFALKTLVGSFLLPFIILLTRGLEPLTNNLLLASVYGGIGLGGGLGLVFMGNSSTGGFTILSKIIEQYRGIGTGKSIVLMDGFIILITALALNTEKAMYAMLVVFITGKSIDVVLSGFNYSKVALIISEKNVEITQGILEQLQRGVTQFEAIGGYSGEHKTALIVAVDQTEVIKLKSIIKVMDRDAFVIFSTANEVLGQGFRLQLRKMDSK